MGSGSRGRPPLPIGAWSPIKHRTVLLASGVTVVEAYTRYRDADGQTRRVVKRGPNQPKADRALLAALTDRKKQTAASTVLGSTTVSELADLWTALEHDWAVNTRETYRYVIDNQIRPQLGSVRIEETRPAHIAAAMGRIRALSGPGAAKTAKTVLAGMFDHAVAMDALMANPARVRVKLARAPKRPVRALTRVEVDELTDALRTSRRAVELDIPDLVDWMLGTGMRIGEAIAVRDSVLDPAARTVEVNATLIRVKGSGLAVQEKPKTAAGWRVLALPDHLTAMLERRHGEARIHPDTIQMLNDNDELRTVPNPGIIFPSPGGHLRDPSNTAGDLREVLDSLGSFEWVTSHVFRKTAATRLDAAGLSARAIADQLGHKRPSMTQDFYMGRNVVSAEAARILDR